MKITFLRFSILAFLLIGCSTTKTPLPDVDPEVKAKLIKYIENNYLTPEDYIINKFRDHDIIFIGEWHRIKHDVQLIQNLIPRLYDAGIYTLATEYARREDQYLIDSLLYGKQYNQKLAEKITFLQFVHWGYQEYVDIFKAAWQLNQNLPAGSRKFRILGLNDSLDWSIIKTQEDRENDEIKKRVWQGGGEYFWAQVILNEVVAKGEQALVYSGIHHAFTEYQQPIYNVSENKFIRFETARMGNFVFKQIGKSAVTIFLHAPWVSAEGYSKKAVYPVDGVIDAVMAELPPSDQRVGFDTKGSPFGELTSQTSFYKYGYDIFTLEMFCDGYIFQKPFSKYEGVTPIKGFVNAENLDYARSQSPNPSFRKATTDDFYNAAVNETNIKKHLSHLY